MIYYSKIDRFERKSNKNSKVKEIFAECGNPIHDLYEYQVVDGINMLVKCGEENRQELIDSYAEAQDINNMIMRFLSGDSDVINPRSGVYGDFTNMPTNYAEMFERVQQCKNIFEKLPADIKEKFDNSPDEFWSSFGTEKFDNVFSEDVPIEIKESEEVKDAE